MALISKKHLSMAIQSLQSIFNKKLKDSKADWNQNDSSADDYVKNRTHWEERKYQKTSLLDSIEHEFVSLDFEDALHLDSLGLVEGQTYTVSWDGKLYDCVAYIAEAPGTPSLGNDIIGEAGETGGNGEPFFITDFDGCLIFAGEVGIHTVEVTFVEDTTIIHKLDKKYLPDDISSKPDWEQNDNTTVDYIKNRPFYDDAPKELNISNQTVTLVDNDDVSTGTCTLEFRPNYGVEFKAIFDGVGYYGVVQKDSDSKSNMYSFNLLTGEHVKIMEDGGISITPAITGEHTLEVYEIYGEPKKIHKRFLPDEIQKIQSVITIDDNGDTFINSDTAYIGSSEDLENAEKIITEKNFYDPKKYLVVTDEVDGYNYFITTRNGNIVSYIQTKSIAVTTMPNKTIYVDHEEFNPEGMIVTATGVDGSTREIPNYTYGVVTTENASKFTISYTEAGITYTTTISLTLHDFSLIDFKYTANEDGTYTLTAWNGTYNGEASTRIIVPDSELIIV